MWASSRSRVGGSEKVGVVGLGAMGAGIAQLCIEAGIETAVHYPLPIHLQPVMERYGYRPGSLPVTESIARDCISLPLYPEMPAGDVECVVEALAASLQPGVLEAR